MTRLNEALEAGLAAGLENSRRVAAEHLSITGSLMTLNQLETHLSGAADMLRGAVDQADFKSYIFPLLFFKRLSDVYVQEYLDAWAEADFDQEYAEFEENHHFIIPLGHHWSDLRDRTEDYGKHLVESMIAIENANPKTLAGVFGQKNIWTNKSRLPDATMRELIEHFSRRPLTNELVSPDMLGNAYEYLIKQFADQSNKKAGEYYTPREVVRMLVDILAPKAGETFYDPTCGTGGMLIEIIKHVQEGGGDPKLLRNHLFGQEKVLATSAIARMNLVLHGVEDFHIARGDTLRDPKFLNDDTTLRTFDGVIANPPFGLKKWGQDTWATDPHGRAAYGGVPRKESAEWAFVQHMFASMHEERGRAVVVLPNGPLFRGGNEQRIRSWFVDQDAVEGVIQLGSNLFYGTGIAACVLVLRRTKNERAGRIRFVDASDLFLKRSNQNILAPEHEAEILRAYRSDHDEAGRAATVPIEVVAQEGHTLSIGRWVKKENTVLSLPEALQQLSTVRVETENTRDRMNAELTKWGL